MLLVKFGLKNTVFVIATLPVNLTLCKTGSNLFTSADRLLFDESGAGNRVLES